MSQQSALVVLVATFGLIGLVLIAALVISTVRQQRRLIRSRANFAGRLLAAQDKERAAIARELHDGTVPRMIAIASTVRRADTGEREALVAECDALIEDLRYLARGMHPSVLDHVGLGDALHELAATLQDREGITVEYTASGGPDDLPPPFRLTLYRVAQEALRNAARYAEVSIVSIALIIDEQELRLTIADAGCGFDPKKAAEAPGLGLTSMRERLLLIGGTLHCETAPGMGTTITAVLPRRRVA